MRWHPRGCHITPSSPLPFSLQPPNPPSSPVSGEAGDGSVGGKGDNFMGVLRPGKLRKAAEGLRRAGGGVGRVDAPPTAASGGFSSGQLWRPIYTLQPSDQSGKARDGWQTVRGRRWRGQGHVGRLGRASIRLGWWAAAVGFGRVFGVASGGGLGWSLVGFVADGEGKRMVGVVRHGVTGGSSNQAWKMAARHGEKREGEKKV